MAYVHLTESERNVIYNMKYLEYSVVDIARSVGKSRATIYREVNRNANSDGRYIPDVSQIKANSRKRFKVVSPKTGNKRLMNYVRSKLRSYWSPEQISGRLSEHAHANDPSMQISCQTIYRWIWSDTQRSAELKPFMRIASKPRRQRYGMPSARGLIPDRVPIAQRPEEVEHRERYGDWEGDTIVGIRHKSFVMTCVDRMSRYLVAGKMCDKQSLSLNSAMFTAFKNIAMSKRQTLTVDNGKEFAGFKELRRELGLAVYFADPYSSWQRGTNENTNGLLRQFFPKKTDFSKVEKKELAFIVNMLNNRPRKCLNYQTPAEVFNEPVVALRM